MAKDDKTDIIMINGETLVKEITTLQVKFELLVKDNRELQEEGKQKVGNKIELC